ncbi:hypothetical protein S40288_07588 [Stachybotrys chartarum IBT 40288]|nr:hypothetical protein S40288_07588 [Stachybotrys chartarum IBT 40288]
MADPSASRQALCQIVAPVGNLGYGFDEILTRHELAKLVPTGIPTALILDSGSTDSGPNKLALGSTTCPRSAYVKDLAKMLKLVHMFRIPLIFGSAGGDGADEHIAMPAIVETCLSELHRDYRFKTISIFASIDKKIVHERLRNGRVTGCGVCVPELTEDDIIQSVRIVAQVGHEPFLDAMESYPDFDVIIGGRAYDPAPFVAYCLHQMKIWFPNTPPEKLEAIHGGFLHMGKIMECGGQCSTPKSHGAIATVYPDGVFDVQALAPASRCTPLSVAAHTLYENTRPDILRGPGGALYLNECKYEQLADGRTTRVCGSVYRPSNKDGSPYQWKLEAARVMGYRSMFMGSVRDHILIGQIDNLLKRIRAYVEHQHPDVPGQWDLGFHVYGKGQSGPNGPGELFIVGETIAPTQQLATSLAAKARIAMIHGPYHGQKATSGNLAFGIGGLMEVELGRCAQFSIYHLMELEPGEERLESANSADTQKSRGLATANCRIIGTGKPGVADEKLFLSITSLRQNLSKPNVKNPYLIDHQDHISAGASPKTLSDLASVLRSKNAGPYEITIDVMFKSIADYQLVKNSDILSAENLAVALGLPKKDIVWMGYFEPALAFKITIPRYRGGKMTSSGSFMEDDVHGSQQHNAIAALKLPPESVSSSAGFISKFHRHTVLGLLAAWGSFSLLREVVRRLEGLHI